MPNLPYSTSGWTTHRQVGTTRFNFLFPDNPSIYTVERTYEGPLANYAAPTMLGTDATYTSHYLVAQSPFEALDGACIRYTRTWAPIPSDRTIYGATGFPRPNLHDLKSGSFYGVSFDDGASSWIFPARKTASISGEPDVPEGTQGATRASLGHTLITVELNNSQQTFYTDDSDSTIWNALSNAALGDTSQASGTFFPLVRNDGSLVVGRSTAGITVRFLSSDSANVTVEPGSGVPLGAAVADGDQIIVIRALQTNSASTRTISSTGHGGAAGNRVALYNGDKIVALARVVAAATDSFTVPLDALPGADAVVTHCVFDKDGLRLANGLDSVSTKHTTTWRLPGVSAGITTAADIPLADVENTGPAWLAAIVASSLTSVTSTASNDRFTKTAHGLSTGQVVFLTANTSGTGYSTLTLYYVIRVDADNFKLATSQAAAIAGNALDVTADGTGITVVVPTQWPVIETPGLERWLGSDIYARTTISAQMADALDQLTAIA